MTKYTPEQRIRIFWSHVDKSGGDDACWLWLAHKDREGYGRSAMAGEFLAHRVSYTLANGQIPDGLCVLHKCDIPACCNPLHLRLGTQLENIQDRVKKRRSAAGLRNGRSTQPERNGAYTHPERIPRGEKHPFAKLTEDNVRAIRQRYASGGITQQALADEYGVGNSVICTIVKRKRWKHVLD